MGPSSGVERGCSGITDTILSKERNQGLNLGYLLEHAIFHNSLEPTLKKVHKLGFDLVEISDGIIDLSPEDKIKISKEVKGHGFEFLVAVGKKIPPLAFAGGDRVPARGSSSV